MTVIHIIIVKTKSIDTSTRADSPVRNTLKQKPDVETPPRKKQKLGKDDFMVQLELIEENTYCWPTVDDGYTVTQVESAKYVKCKRY